MSIVSIDWTIASNALERMWNETVVAQIKILSRIVAGWTEKEEENFV
jgi:hypothetical protein